MRKIPLIACPFIVLATIATMHIGYKHYKPLYAKSYWSKNPNIFESPVILIQSVKEQVVSTKNR